MSIEAIDHVRRMMGLLWGIYMIPSNGLSGGIIIAWKLVLGQVDFLHTNRQVAFGIISSGTGQAWTIAVVYASTCGIERRTL